MSNNAHESKSEPDRSELAPASDPGLASGSSSRKQKRSGMYTRRKAIGRKQKGKAKSLKFKKECLAGVPSEVEEAGSLDMTSESESNTEEERTDDIVVGALSSAETVHAGVEVVEPKGKDRKKYKKRKGRLDMPRKQPRAIKEKQGISDVTSEVSVKVVHVEHSERDSVYEHSIADLIIEDLEIEIGSSVLESSDDPSVPVQGEPVEMEICEESSIPWSSEATPGGPVQTIGDIIIDAEAMSEIAYLKINLSLLLSEKDWIIDSSLDAVGLSLLSPFENVAVQKSIIWSKKGFKIFVHNKPLPAYHFLWDCTKIQDCYNLGEVSDCLARLANLIECANVCSGVQSYKRFWSERQDRGLGSFEEVRYGNSNCYRSKDCSLIVVEASMCKACKQDYNIFKCKNYKSLRQKASNQSKINNKYLSRNQLLVKAKNLQSSNRQKDKYLLKLKKRVKELLKSTTLNVSSDLGKDLAQIFQSHHDKMTATQRIFWSEQLKALSKQDKRRSMRWNPFVIRLALHLQMVSKSAYEYLQNFISLPSKRTLFDFTHYVEAKEGIQDAVITKVKNCAEKSSVERDEFYCLLFDEMQIRSDIVVHRKTGKVVGYTHLEKVEEELKQLEAELTGAQKYHPKPAKKVLVFMLQSITEDIKEVVGIYPTECLSASQLYLRSWDVIFELEKAGLQVLALIFDGASMNKKFISMHLSFDKKVDFVYVTKNQASGEDRPLFFIVDPPHILKTLRNCFANSFCHRKSRQLWKNNQHISWEVINILYEITLQDKFRETKLTQAHCKLTSYSCMTVRYATQVLSSSVKTQLSLHQNDPRFKGMVTDVLLSFIGHCNDFFDCLNGGDEQGQRIKKNHLLLAYTDPDDPRFSYLISDFLGFFEEWESDVMTRAGRFSKAARERMFISKQTYDSLKVTVHSFVGAVKYLLGKGVNTVKARRFNQDKLEQYFGLMRMSLGANTNPSSSEFCAKSLSLHVQGQAAQPVSKGNTEISTEILVDESPLPKRKRRL